MTGIDWPTLWQVTYTVAGIAVASAAAGLLSVRLLAKRSLGTLLFVVAAVVIVSTMAGVGVITWQMVLSPADRNVVLAVVIVAGVAGFAVALLVGHRVTAVSRVLLGAVADVASNRYYEPPDAKLPAEFAKLSEGLSAAHERLAESRTRERALEASRRELVAWVSHDLRTPLARLRAMAEALEDGVVVDYETVATYHTQIRREADRLSAMIDDLFELARIHAGALRLSRRLVGLDDLVAEALVASTEPLARAKGVRLHGSSGTRAAGAGGRRRVRPGPAQPGHQRDPAHPVRWAGRGAGRPAPGHGLRQRGGRLRRDSRGTRCPGSSTWRSARRPPAPPGRTTTPGWASASPAASWRRTPGRSPCRTSPTAASS